VATCFIWAAVYLIISVLIKDLDMEIYRAREDWIDENNIILLRELKSGFVRTPDIAMEVQKGTPF
jgi:hypothetical protein